MRKREELSEPGSCLAKAEPDELIFVLLGRDAAAPEAIRAWAKARVDLGKNAPRDRQILDALKIASLMEHERAQPRRVAVETGDVET